MRFRSDCCDVLFAFIQWARALLESIGYARIIMERHERADPTSVQRMLAAPLRDAEFGVEFERVRNEMFGQFAPAIEGPVVHAGRKRRGRLLFGDATE